MGQTLTNGIYLPDEGERNSYPGLEVNWRTLDALILTVNGKAAPNIANTWTAAQTFTAGITGDLTGNVTGNVTGDLTGTASKAIADEDGTSIKTGYVNVAGNQTVTGQKTWSGENLYTSNLNVSGFKIHLYDSTDDWTVTPANTVIKEIDFTDKNNSVISYFAFQHRSNTTEPFRTCWRQNKKDGTTDYYSVNFNNLGEFYPEISNTKLGTSSYQWASVYAQTYYYNGTEFSSKFVTTDTEQTITSIKTISRYNSRINLNNTNITKGVIPSSNTTSQYYFGDSTGAEIGRLMYRAVSDGTRQLWIAINDNYANGALDSAGTTNKWNNLFINIEPTGHRVISFDTDAVIPDTSNVNLGTSTNKWKTLNGINPGALSLPDINSLVELDSTNWNLDGTATDIIASGDGWIQVVVKGDSTSYVALQVGYYSYPNCYYRASGNAINDSASAMIPVKSGQGVRMYLKGASVYIARFFPMLGNV